MRWFRRVFSKAPRFEVTIEEFGFGEHKELRAVVSSPWTIGTKELEAYVERHNPFTDPWLEHANARLMIHEEQIMISLPGKSAPALIQEAVLRIKSIRHHLAR